MPTARDHHDNGLPEFVIAGAPKSGTSALYEWLGSHPDVFLPALKEPHFYSEDLPGPASCTTRGAYESLYANAPRRTLRGDFFGLLPCSRVAVPRILEDNPDARFIVILRDPAEAAHAYHSELLYNLSEEVTDFRAAWDLQEDPQGRPSHTRPMPRAESTPVQGDLRLRGATGAILLPRAGDAAPGAVVR